MKSRPPLFTTLLALCGAVFVLHGTYVLETLDRSPAETVLARGLAGLIVGCLFVAMAYARSLLCASQKQTHEPSPTNRNEDMHGEIP
jgi:hypothetical protein